MKLIPIFIVLLLTGCATPKSDDYSTYKTTSRPLKLSNDKPAVLIDDNAPVDFRGVYQSKDQVEQNNIMYYNTGGAAGLFSQIMVHAALTNEMKNKKLLEHQKQANKVLKPLESVLSHFKQKDLYTGSTYQFNPSDSTSQALVIESKPIFFLSQDYRNIELKHLIQAHSKGEGLIYQNIIEVVSPSSKADTPQDLWTKDKGIALKTTAHALYQQSLAVAIKDIRGEYPATTHQKKTYRFYLGQKLRIERGEMIDKSCNSLSIRNLRGWLITFPTENFETCRQSST